MKSLYKIIFTDNTEYDGGDYLETKWLQVPNNKKIKAIYYLMPYGSYLVLGGYDSYYHRIEATKDIMGKNRKNFKLDYAFLYGQKDKKVICYRIDLRTNRGDIKTTVYNLEDVEIKELNYLGWKS